MRCSWHSSNTNFQGETECALPAQAPTEAKQMTSCMFCKELYIEQTLVINQLFQHISLRFWGLEEHFYTEREPAVCEAALCIWTHTVWAAISKTREECVTLCWGDTHALVAHQLDCVWAPFLVGCCLMATGALSASLHIPLSRAVKQNGKSPSACRVSFGFALCSTSLSVHLVSTLIM